MKWKKGNKIISIVCMVLFLVSLVPVLSGHTDTNEASSNYSERFEIQYSAQDLSFSTLDGYDLVSLNGGLSLNEVGKPQVPVQYIRIAVPTGTKITGVSIDNAQTQLLPGSYNLYPAQAAQSLNQQNPNPALQQNPTVYYSEQTYPSFQIQYLSEISLAGQPMGEFIVYPLHYNVNTKQLILITSLSFTVTGSQGYVCNDYLSPAVTMEGRQTYESMVDSMVINPSEVQLGVAQDIPHSLALPSGGPYSHVIITTNALSSAWAPLVQWNTKRGLKDTVVTTEYIYANYAGTTNQQKIRNFVIDAKNTWGCMYYLFGGEISLVPNEYRTFYQESVPSDQYYSDYNDDWVHEVYVGRVSVDTTAQVTLFLNKLLFYEKTPTMTNYILNASLFGFDVDASTREQLLMDNIAGVMPTRFTKNKVYDSDGGNHVTNVINDLNSGQQLVAHGDHGDFDWWGIGYYHHGGGMYSASIDALSNTNKMSIVTTLACDVGGNDYSDSFSEHWVIYNAMKAGIAFNGNVRLGIYYIGDPSNSLSPFLVNYWYRGLFMQSKYVIGETIIWDKMQFPTTGQDYNIKQHCEWQFNLLGEPAMPIWTDTPLDMTVVHPDTLPVGSSSFTVHVTNTTGGTAMPNAYVCLWKGSEVYLTGYTNSNGDITFTPNPTTTGNMNVTVTKHNYVPHESTAQVQQLSNLLVDGHCFYPDQSPANTITVELVNANTGSRWQATTNNNYYSKLLQPGVDINIGNVLRIIARDNQESVNVTEHTITSGDVTLGAIHTDLILRVHYRDLIKFPSYIGMVNAGAGVMKAMLDYCMWNSTTDPNGPPSVYSEQTLYQRYKGSDSVINADELTYGLNTEIDDYHHGWIYGYFFAPYAGVSSTDALKTICVWLDYPINYYNDLRDVPVPKEGHPNHVPIAVPTGGNYNSWMVVRGIHTDRNAWLPPTQLTVYGFWLNDPKFAGIGNNVYVTTSRFLSNYYQPINVLGDVYNGQYVAITDPYQTFDQTKLDNIKITVGKNTASLTVREQVLVLLGENNRGPGVLSPPINNLLLKLAFDQTMAVLKYGDQTLSETFAQSHVLGKPIYKDKNWLVTFGNTDTTFTVRLNSVASLLEFSIQ